MNNTIKAIRATIKLGDIELEGFQKPDGSYGLGVNNLRESLNVLLTDKTGKKYAQPLLDNSLGKVNSYKIDGNNATIKLVDLDLACEIILVYANLGNFNHAC